MTYFVVVTFDIANGTSDDYQTIYSEFEKIGLSRKIVSDNGKSILLPTTTTAGQFNGQSASEVSDYVSKQTNQSFTRNRLHGEIFVAVGGDWSWVHQTP